MRETEERRALRFATCVLTLVGVACDAHQGPNDAGPSTTAVAPGPRPSASPSPSSTRHPPNRLPCRAVTVEGDVHFAAMLASDAGTVPVMTHGLLPLEGWVDLAPSSRLVAKDPRTTRETSFRGPARVRACVDAEEESWVASGTFESAVGAGEVPGAEEWVATPLALLRYAAAKITVDAPGQGKAETMKVAAGVVYVWVAADAQGKLLGADGGGLAPTNVDEGWARLGEGQSASVTVAAPAAGHSGEVDGAERALAKCSTLANTAKEEASAVLRGGADASTVAAQVSTRRLAHAACAVASVRVGSLPDSDKKTALAASLRAADAAYEGLPFGG